MKIPMSSPDLTVEDIQAVNDVLETRYLSRGPKLKAFEESISNYVGCKYAVGVNSGTSGLHLAVIAAGVKENDYVITTPFSFIASANCILFQRAIPIFVDIDPKTFNIDPDRVSQATQDFIEGENLPNKWLPGKVEGPQSGEGNLKAILSVDAFGQPAEYEALEKIADKNDLVLIEDSCEALGSKYKGKNAGSFGDVGVFAFYPNKQMTTGEGGMLVTDREDWAKLFRSLRNQGRGESDQWLNHACLGFNYRMDEMSAALGLSQFKRIEMLLKRRAWVADWYHQRIADTPDVWDLQISSSTTRMSWFVYVIQTTSKHKRDALIKGLNKEDVPSRPYFTPIHLQPFYRKSFGYQKGDYPETEHAADTCLALPFSSVMTEDQVAFVCNKIQDILSSS